MQNSASRLGADLLKPHVDKAIARFAGKKPTPSIARRMEIAIVAALKRDPQLALFSKLSPIVWIDQETGRPSVFFILSVETANSNAA